MSRTLLVTGGAGFIGVNFVRAALARGPATHIVILDKLTYAGNRRSLVDLGDMGRHTFVCGDIGDRRLVRQLLRKHTPDAIVHFAAESHVDRSISDPDAFIQTNVVGTFHLLDEVRCWLTKPRDADRTFRFLHVSTDEVYGALGPEGLFSETTAYSPNSPYSASKAASDHLVRAYHHTYGLPVITTNCSNNYGPYQFPEKLIPLMISNALAGRSLPIYGLGDNVRDWIYVDDHCAALLAVLERGCAGQTYCIGARTERRNVDVVHTICDALDRARPRMNGSHRELITFVRDRPGHDFRYAIDPGKIERDLEWQPDESFDSGIRKTIDWYLTHRSWTADILSGAYREPETRSDSVVKAGGR